MAFNYGKEKARFEREWNKLRAEYSAFGMESEAIEEMYDFDKKVFLSTRTYSIHTQPYPQEDVRLIQDGEASKLRIKYPSLTTSFSEDNFVSRYAWVDTLDNEDYVRQIKALATSDLELLTLFVIEGYTQAEIAKKMHCNQSVVSRKIMRLKKLFKKIF